MLALLAVVVGGGYLYLRLDDEIRRKVESQIAAHYSGMDVHVGRARFEQDRGIAIFDISISERATGTSPRPMLLIGEMYLAGKARMENLVMRDLVFEEIVVRRVELRAVRAIDGTLNVQSLMPLPAFGEQPANVRVEDATLIVEDAARPGISHTFQGIDLALTPIQNDQLSASGTKHFRIEGAAAGVPARELRFQGEMGTTDGLIALTVEIRGLEVSSETLAALPGVPNGLLAGAEMSGRADATVQVSRDGLGQPLLWSVDAAVDRGRVNHSLLTESLSEIRFTAHASADGLTVKRLDAKYGSAAIALAAQRVGWSRNAPVGLSANVVGVQLDDRTPARFPESVARVWQRFRPNGTLNAGLRLQFDGKSWRPEVTVKCCGISFTDRDKFPYLLEQTTGDVVYEPAKDGGTDRLTLNLVSMGGGWPVTIKADLTNLAPSEPVGITTDTGVAAEENRAAGERVAGYRGRPSLRRASPRPHPTGWVEVASTDMPLHEQLIAAIPAHGRSFVQSLQARGAVDFTFRSEWKQPSQPRAEVTLDIGLKDCSMDYERFPLPLRGVRGSVTARDWQWKVNDVVAFGTNNATIIRCGGDVKTEDGTWHADLNFKGENLALDESLKSALPPTGKIAWDELRPQGRIDLTAHVLHDSGREQPLVEVTIKPREKSVSLQLARFPYRLEEVDGEATYKPGRVEFRNVLAKHDREAFSIESGIWNATGGGGWQVVMNGCNVDRVAPHRELIGAMPARLQKAIERLQPQGTFGIYNGSLSFASAPGAERTAAAWDVQLDCHQAVFRGALPLQSVTGGVRLFGRDDAQLSYAAGELDLDSVICNDVQLTNVHGPLWVDGTHCFLGEQATQKLGQPARRMTGDAYGGSLAGNVIIRHDNGANYQVDLALGAADLARFANERLGGPTDMNGKMSGKLTLSGSGSSLQSLVGSGELHVVDANIYKLPVLVSMLKVPNLRNRTPDTTAFDRCDLKFTVQGEHMYFEQLNLMGDAVSLYGKGESGFDRRLDLVFYTLLEPAVPIPLWKTIAGPVSQQTLQLKVVGTWDDPEVKPETLPGVSQVLEQIQTEFGGANKPEPATAARNRATPAR